MKHFRHGCGLIWLIICLTGCHPSGTWVDDPKNFERIFNDEKPANLVVVHSWYWRSKQFATEFEYFLEVQPNAEFQNGLWQNTKLKVPNTDAEQRAILHFSPPAKPDWFLPKSLEHYDVWIYDNKPYFHFRVFIDKETHELFLTDYQ